jgi:hypothetical protein
LTGRQVSGLILWWGGSLEPLCLDLDTLIRVKRAAGRPKDFEAIAELEALREELRGD